MNERRRIAEVLLGLRASVLLVMLVWALNKFMDPAHAAKVYGSFYLIGGLGRGVMYMIGAVELIVLAGFAAGIRKRLTYGAVFLLHAISTVSSFRQYLAPFQNILFFAAWPMLAACFALYRLRDLDTMWTAKGAARWMGIEGAQSPGGPE